jgi:hypothetical protein
VEKEVFPSEQDANEHHVVNGKAIFGTDVIDTNLSVLPKKSSNGYAVVETDNEKEVLPSEQNEHHAVNRKAIFCTDVIDTNLSVLPKKSSNGYAMVQTDDESQVVTETDIRNDNLVAKSTGDLSYHRLQTGEIEMELLKGYKSSEFITLEKTDNTQILKVKAGSLEYVIKPDQ